MLVRDRGIRGIVISLKDGLQSAREISLIENPENPGMVLVQVGAGVKMSYLAKYTARHGLSGLEGLVGVPGSLGGALIMNAGAEGIEIGPSVRSVSRINEKGEVERLNRDQLDFQYRKTIFPPGGGVIFKAELELRKGSLVEIQEKIDSHLRKRARTQPLDIPNSGSVFRNPPGEKAGRLIEELNLKGYHSKDEHQLIYLYLKDQDQRS